MFHTIIVNYKGRHGHLWCINLKRRNNFTLVTQDEAQNYNPIDTMVPLYNQNGELPVLKECIDKTWQPF